jgi:hypothetical protein
MSLALTKHVHQVRIIYRIAEYAGAGPSNLQETYGYAFDALPMILALLALALFHPGRFLIGPDSEFKKISHAEKRAQDAWRKHETMEMQARPADTYGFGPSQS